MFIYNKSDNCLVRVDDLSINLQYAAAETCQHVLQKQVLLGALKGGEEWGGD